MTPDTSSDHTPLRLRIAVFGAVQGVGFRPFVYRLATEMSLAGWVLNSTQGVRIEVEGTRSVLDRFIRRLRTELPPRAVVQSVEQSFLDGVGYTGFEIRHSDDAGETSALILPDIAVCPDCLREMRDPADRRYRYPFTNCTNCGPRFTIIERLPYDRPNTSMRRFGMCDDCRREYEDPSHRRFHAQPIACPACGPHLELWDDHGAVRSRHDDSLRDAVTLLTEGRIVAVKGLGGFHLMVDASNQAAVDRLRQRKHREEKPFALMAPSLDAVRSVCVVSEVEERLLTSPESPIVLLERRPGRQSAITETVAPANPYLGVMLPYTPLHHLLMDAVQTWLVATSGNRSDEPICTDEHEAVERLAGIADAFLVHDRPIVRHADDSIVRMMHGRELVCRRARGYAPLPVPVPDVSPAARILAVGPHLKNTVAVVSHGNAFVSQHIGDLESKESLDAFQAVAHDLQVLLNCSPTAVACDQHPDYVSSQYARRSGLAVEPVQHHLAHVASCMAENELTGSVLGVSWDGTGFGPDGTIWGGEFLITDGTTATRFARLRPFPLPGGDAAVREPRRSALGVLSELSDRAGRLGVDNPTGGAFSPAELDVLHQAMARGINTPLTSSAGRLFDAVASLLDIRQVCSFEGQAAMELEFAAGTATEETPYPFLIGPAAHNEPRLAEVDAAYEIDWRETVRGVMADRSKGVSREVIAQRFHATLAEMIVAVCQTSGMERIVLSGGCFQNRILLERTIDRLTACRIRPYWHQRIPTNDGGIALGQAWVALRRNRSDRPEQ